jgi:hypothetical protein
MSKNSPFAAKTEGAYVPPYSSVLETIGLQSFSDGAARSTVEASDVIKVIRLMLRGVSVDEAWYRRTYQDVDSAIQSGQYSSAKHHFVENGYFEGRRPGPVIVDDQWYLDTYPDVAEGIENGEIDSPQRHFEEHGYSEGRFPRQY